MNATDAAMIQDFGAPQAVGAFALVLAAIALSRFLKLDLEKDFFVASLRTTLQLLAVGFVLRWILGSDSLAVNLTALLVMSVAASQAVSSRLKEKTFRIFLAVQAAVLVGVWPMGLAFLGVIFGESAYTKAALFIPFMGVLLGNALSAVSLTFLGLERIRSENLLEVETFLALGATPFEACKRLYRDLLRHSLTPILNAMTIVGVVSLPGVMAGQLLGGVDPMSAARTQILVMLLVLITAMLGSITALALFHSHFMPSWMHQRDKTCTLRIADCRQLALSGPSGSGKSRLLKSMTGLDDENIQKDFFSRFPLASREPVTGRQIYLHQKPHFVPGTVEENLLWPLRFRANAGCLGDESSILKHLQSLGISPAVLRQSATTLSGGESQMIHLLRCLLINPEILFLDEPTASMDSQRVALVEKLLNEWVAEKDQRRFVIITHSVEQIRRICTGVLDLKEGRFHNS